MSDSSTTVLQVVERGTYAISIQSIVSTPQKFQQIGLTRAQLASTKLINNHCFHANFTSMVASVNENDGGKGGLLAMAMSFMGMINKENRYRVLGTMDEMHDLREFATCRHSEMPEHFPISDEGFER